MNYERYGKLFSARDSDFTFCRSFLIISMIFTHVFQNLYLPDYNRRLTYFVTIGFVLISGFVLGGRNSQLIGRNPSKFFIRYLKRFIKIFIVYITCNIPIIILEPSRLNIIQDTPIYSLVLMVLSGEASAVFGFDILPAIALTTLFSWVVMGATRRMKFKTFFLSPIPFLLLWLFELFIGARFTALRLLLVGIFGCLLGKACSHINWNRFLKVMSAPKTMLASGAIIALYFIVLTLRYWPNGPILLWRHLIPTVLLLFFIYMLSFVLKLGYIRWVHFMNSTIGEYLLFSYIFHIGLIKLAYLLIGSNLNYQDTLFVGILLTGITIGVCYCVDLGRKRVVLVSRIYSAFFSL